MKLIFKNCFQLLFNFYIINVFFITKCRTNFIFESQLDDLRDSVKHFLNVKKNVTHIPHDCSDRPSIELDIVFEEESVDSSKYYAVYGNYSYYVVIDGITRDHLPIVHRDTQPLPVDSRFRRIMKGKHPISQYKFVGPLYLHKIPNEKGKYSLVGFNQVWLGCPQPLCISPGFDGILSLMSMSDPSYPFHFGHNNLLLVFRGNYFWYYNFADKSPIRPPLTDSANRIEERFFDRRANFQFQRKYRRGRDRGPAPDHPIIHLNDSMVVPTYIDAVVPGMNRYNNCLYFFRRDEFVCYAFSSELSAPKKIASEWKSSDPTWNSAQIDAAFHWMSLIYFIAGEQLWCFASDRTLCHTYPKNLKELHHNFPANITSAFQHKEYLYIIKGSVYYKMLKKRFPSQLTDEDMVERYLFQDLLGCDESLYTAWGFHSYDQFIHNFADKMNTGINSTVDNKESHFNPTLLIITILMVTIGSALILIVWYLRPVWMTKVIQTLKSPFR